jgi:hypothetical protein
MAKILEPDEMFFKEFEPKLQNRFIMYISGIPSYVVKASDRPKLAFNTIVMDHINTKRKLLGKGDWQDISITLYDPINPSGAQTAIEWIRLGYESVTGRAGYADFYKKEVTLNMLGPVGDVVEEWKLKGAFVSNADWGSLDWSNAEPTNITLVISYDYAVLEF